MNLFFKAFRFYAVLFLMISFSSSLWAALSLGSVAEAIHLEGKDGQRVTGQSWDSQEMKGKVSVLFYVDPDAEKLNKEVEEALNEQNFPKDKYQSVAVVNMAATWLPNFAIESKLASKQKQYSDVTYVKDFDKVLHKKWGLEDDSSDILAFDQENRLIFRKDGKLSANDVAQLISVIKANL